MKLKEILITSSFIKQKRMPFYTNYYHQCDDMENDEFLTFKTESALVFLWNDMGVKRIYFFASALEELKNILSHIDQESVIDFITKDKEALREVFEAAGYSRYMEYGRFYQKYDNIEVERLQQNIYSEEFKNKFANSSYGEAALESDAEEIDRHLRRVFDPYEAHFYSMEKLKEHIRKGWVLIAKEKGKIIAGTLFEVQGKKGYGAYIWNDGVIEVLSVLNYKMGKYFGSLDIKYFYCWMRLDNKRIIRYNMKFMGFVADGLYDMIYVKR